MFVDALKPPYRIYVVEDSSIILRLLSEFLGAIPGVLIVGHSGRAEEAIAQIGSTTPDAVIVDLMLQSGTGFDVLEAVARQGPVPARTIVLSNLSMAPYRERAARLGAAHYFDKSTEILQTFRVVNRWVEEHLQQSDPYRQQS